MNLDYIFSPQAVRDSAQKVFDYTHYLHLQTIQEHLHLLIY